MADSSAGVIIGFMDVCSRILIVSNCRFGDSLIMVPSLQLLRKAYPQSEICLVSEGESNGIVSAEAILGNRGLVDAFMGMPVQTKRFSRLMAWLKLLVRLRKKRWDLGIVLIPPYAPLTLRLVRRFCLYLRCWGAKRVVAPSAILQPSEPARHVIDATLSLLEPLGLPLPPVGKAPFWLPPLREDDGSGRRAEELCGDVRGDDVLLAVGLSTNMPSKQWPLENFEQVLSAVVREHRIRLVFFGSAKDRESLSGMCDRLDGIPVFGERLSTVVQVMSRCSGYFGQDTGVMHLAAIEGKPCVALFSGRDPAGMWDPYGEGHRVLRIADVPCRLCHAVRCPYPHHRCMAHRMDDVLIALRTLLQTVCGRS